MRIINQRKEVNTMYYKTCPLCGAALDPGESCDCATKGPKTEPAEKSEEVPKPKRASPDKVALYVQQIRERFAAGKEVST